MSQNIFSQLCFIAYKGMESNQIIYSSHDLQRIDVNLSSDLGLLVTTPSTSVYGIEKSYNFLHKILQEFCAAWYISKLSLNDQLKCINTYWKENNFTMVWRFYSGITGLKEKEALKCILPYKFIKSDLAKSRIPHLIDCVYEAHNTIVCQIVGDHLNGTIDLRTLLFGINHIGYFLSQYKGTLRQINASIWNDDSFKVFIRLLLSRLSIQSSDSLVLNVPHCKFTNQSYSFLTKLLGAQYPIIELHITDTIFQSKDAQGSSGATHLSHMKLLSQICTINTSLRVLDISRTYIGPDGASCFASLRNVRLYDFRLVRCKLGPTGADKIGEMLYYNSSIVSLNISRNNIKDSGVEQLIYHLNSTNKLQHLDLCSNNITSVGASHLKRLLAIDHPTLTSIELSCNPLKDDRVQAILSFNK